MSSPLSPQTYTKQQNTLSLLLCTIVSVTCALLFFIWYYSPHGNAFTLRFYFGSSLIISLLIGFFLFIISFSILRFPKFQHYLLNKDALQQIKLETSANCFDPESMEEKICNPQPLSNDLYYDPWKY